jgi:hypothetical protein
MTAELAPRARGPALDAACTVNLDGRGDRGRAAELDAAVVASGTGRAGCDARGRPARSRWSRARRPSLRRERAAELDAAFQ